MVKDSNQNEVKVGDKIQLTSTKIVTIKSISGPFGHFADSFYRVFTKEGEPKFLIAEGSSFIGKLNYPIIKKK